ncbi:hypothetical protein NDI44_03685 [Trichocoleus sp. DQ-A3]|uniref:hypothetical protein n=1 Tax=Cyanophyceae TaxID=3028117 RepID=UPI001682E70B|nr:MULTISPECIES: hypothetical protein [unclassified Coleofasciculus]MBD1893925.1 hypothetical protein [Coleofasciculus sp. FACHB-129]MBD1900818.1 hypothetical protein [Coleofasciculus sp. FACHB-125]
MLFNSYTFIFCFLPITLIGFFALKKFRLIWVAIAWLLLASLAFYSYWSITFLPVLLGLIAVNYSVSRLIRQAIAT